MGQQITLEQSILETEQKEVQIKKFEKCFALPTKEEEEMWNTFGVKEKAEYITWSSQKEYAHLPNMKLKNIGKYL